MKSLTIAEVAFSRDSQIPVLGANSLAPSGLVPFFRHHTHGLRRELHSLRRVAAVFFGLLSGKLRHPAHEFALPQPWEPHDPAFPAGRESCMLNGLERISHL